MERISRPARWVLVIAMVVLGLACMVQAKNVADANATIAASQPSTSAPAAQPACLDSGKGLFNDCAVLDTAQIDDLRSVADKGDYLFVAEDGHLIAADAE
jgi:hypothetical protein